jgi:hypothetical protein
MLKFIYDFLLGESAQQKANIKWKNLRKTLKF